MRVRTLVLVAAIVSVAVGTAAALTFQDAAAGAGISVFYASEGVQPPPWQTTGGGVCWGDFDGDGLEDLFFTATYVTGSELRARLDPRASLYRNDGDGTFSRVGDGSGADVRGSGQGCSVVDYDADGDFDLLYTGYGWVALLRNDGPFRFTNVTVAAGMSTEGRCGELPCFSTGSSWADVNRDGCLDAYVANYGNETRVSFTNPSVWPGQANLYFESRCDGTFDERSVELNLDDDPGPDHSRSYMPAWLDFDGDGLLDVFIAADATPDSLLRQKADGTFEDVAVAAGVADPRAGMGLAADDVDGDGWTDLYFTHYFLEHNGFYVNARNGTFEDRSGDGELASDWPEIGWGTGFHDFDHDGLKDIYVVNGHTYFYPEGSLQSPNGPNMTRRMWLQRADGAFREVTQDAGPGITMRTVARGSAAADFDLDGDLDLVVANVHNGTANLLRASGVTGRWLEIELRDPGSANRFAVGAQVSVEAEGSGRTSHRTVRAGSSFLSQDSYRLHFGLGESARADVTVRWPDGSTDLFASVSGDRIVRVTRGSAALEEDVVSPLTRLDVEGDRGEGGWIVEAATASLHARDRGATLVSGVARVEVALGGAPLAPFGGAFPLVEGVHSLSWRAVDGAGNVEPLRAATVRVDATPPVAQVAVDGPSTAGWFTTLPTVAPVASDATSGVARVDVRVDDGDWTPRNSHFTLPPGDGERALAVRATDAAGLRSATSGALFRVDANPPSTTLRVVAGPALDRGDVLDVTSATRLGLDATDGAGSGVARTEWRVDGGPWQAFDAPFSLDGPDREMVLEWRSVDAVGHAEGARARRVFLDNQRPPPIELVTPAEGRAYVGNAVEVSLEAPAPADAAFVVGRVTVRAFAGQDVSGVAWTRAIVDGVEVARAQGDRLEWTWSPAPGEHRLEVESADGLGNASRAGVRVVAVGVPGVP